MQRNMPTSPPNSALNPIDDVVGVGAVDYTADFDGLYKRVDNLNKFYEKWEGAGEFDKVYLRVGKAYLSRAEKPRSRKKSLRRQNL